MNRKKPKPSVAALKRRIAYLENQILEWQRWQISVAMAAREAPQP